jgi:hypothetical protein
MDTVAAITIAALRAHGVCELPTYEQALASACDASPPPFGAPHYAELYRSCSSDPDWVALSLLTAAQSEGEGARHLWDMAACTEDTEVARQIQRHAIDESRHSLGYVTLLGLIFPHLVDETARRRLSTLSPGYTLDAPLSPTAGSAYAYSASVDELIQMNIAEIRTRIYHLLQRPVLLAQHHQSPEGRRIRRILDSLLLDETRHVADTARLIERSAQRSGAQEVIELMHERVKDFNTITENELESGTLSAAS